MPSETPSVAMGDVLNAVNDAQMTAVWGISFVIFLISVALVTVLFRRRSDG